MAFLRWFVTNALVSVHQEMSETSPGADQTTSPNYGWTVGVVAPTVYSKADSGVERASGTFAATPIEPDGTIDTVIGDCWRTALRYKGTFVAANGIDAWQFYFGVIAVTSGGDQDGRVGIRLFRGAAEDGSGAVEITAGRVVGSIVTNLTTLLQQESHIEIMTIPEFTVNDEFLFVQVGWEITGAGGAADRDVIVRIGDTVLTGVLSTDFVSAGGKSPRPAMTGPQVSPGGRAV